ncbi:hypothetical protein ABZW10_00515 [Kitasatospora sp. NPDC004723]|uniref:hypothetical protein n=1 Tax=Kitasatospora sp. NPDC004723 TaxID=3154288 RepID=UPI0033A341A7
MTTVPDLGWVPMQVFEALDSTDAGELLIEKHSIGRPTDLPSWVLSTKFPSVAVDLLSHLGSADAGAAVTIGAHTKVRVNAPSIRLTMDGPMSLTSALVHQPKTNCLVPCIEARFRLAEAYHLGAFRFRSSSWDLAETVMGVQDELARATRPVLCELTLLQVAFTTRTGDSRFFQRPVLTVLRGDTPAAK